MADHQVVAPHVPSLCLFGSMFLFVLGLVPLRGRRESVFLFVFLWRLLEFLRLKAVAGLNTPYGIKEAAISSTARNHTHNPQHEHPFVSIFCVASIFLTNDAT